MSIPSAPYNLTSSINPTPVNTSPHRSHLVRTAMNRPLLSREHELDLARRWRDEQDEAALEELTSAYLRLVISVATRFRHYGLPVADLIQEGTVGLMQAANRFEPERNVRFSTYASWWVRSSIQEFILRNWSIVRTGTTTAQKSLFFKLRRLRQRIGIEAGAVMTPEARRQIAETLGVRVTDVEMMEGRMMAPDSSLNARLGEDANIEWQERLEDERPNPEDLAVHASDTALRRGWLDRALKELTQRERAIIEARQLSDDRITLAELGIEFGISKERVRQIEQNALDKMRCRLYQLAESAFGLELEGQRTSLPV